MHLHLTKTFFPQLLPNWPLLSLCPSASAWRKFLRVRSAKRKCSTQKSELYFWDVQTKVSHKPSALSWPSSVCSGHPQLLSFQKWAFHSVDDKKKKSYYLNKGHHLYFFKEKKVGDYLVFKPFNVNFKRFNIVALKPKPEKRSVWKIKSCFKDNVWGVSLMYQFGEAALGLASSLLGLS